MREPRDSWGRTGAEDASGVRAARTHCTRATSAVRGGAPTGEEEMLSAAAGLDQAGVGLPGGQHARRAGPCGAPRDRYAHLHEAEHAAVGVLRLDRADQR